MAAIAILLIACALVVPGAALGWEVDATATVTRVIDGDTFDSSPAGRIRLADIDAPEYDEPGYQEPKDYLIGLIGNELVYLDIDDIYGTDPFNRTVAVVYVRHNATHLLNVNEALVNRDAVVVMDYPNEFDPAAWSLYVFYPVASPPLEGISSASPSEGSAPLAVNFSATASGGLPPYAFLWDFEDGSTSTVQNPSHAYLTAGTYIVTVTIADAAGHTTTDTLRIQVFENASPAPRGDPGAWGATLIAAGLLIVIAVVGVVLLLRRRRTPPRPK